MKSRTSFSVISPAAIISRGSDRSSGRSAKDQLIVFGLVNRDPVDFGCRHPGLMGEIVDCRCEHEFVFGDPWVDAERLAFAGPHRHPVIEEAVLRRRHSRHHRGVVRPSDGGIDGLHALRYGALFGKPADRGQGQAQVVEFVGGKPSMLMTMTWRSLA